MLIFPSIVLFGGQLNSLKVIQVFHSHISVWSQVFSEWDESYDKATLMTKMEAKRDVFDGKYQFTEFL